MKNKTNEKNLLLNVPDILRDKKDKNNYIHETKKNCFVKSIDHCSISVELFEGCFIFETSDVSSFIFIDES